MLTQLKTNPAVRKELQGMGYSDEHISEWVAEATPGAAQQSVGADQLPAGAAGAAEQKQQLPPAATPAIRIVKARKTGAAQVSSASLSQPGQPSWVSFCF